QNSLVSVKAVPRQVRKAREAGESPVRCLMIASAFPPIHGGSAVVYENLCSDMPAGTMRVLSAKKNYLNNRDIDGWADSDAEAGFPIDRVELLRPLMMPPPAGTLDSLRRFVFLDLPLYANVLLKAAYIVRRHKINVVCIGELVAGTWIGIALRKLFGVKLVIYIHGEEVTTVTGGRLTGDKRKTFLNAADRIVAVSSFTCDELTRTMDLPPGRISMIQNGVDTERFYPAPVNAMLIRKHGLAGKKVILTVARLVPRKGVDMAIQAIAQLARSRTDFHYLIVGDGESRAELEKMIVDLQLQGVATLVGKAGDDELVDYFRLCDVFLMPNRTLDDGDTEGFGLVFREANACGKPVIGGRAGGVVEAVIDGKTGFLVDGGNVAEIAATVDRLLSDANLARQISANGLRMAQENNTRAVARQFLRMCDRLLQH
ncbi:MAG: glycosyltransferase family 4 protein, partial [Janthinobacterium lividum]